MIPPLVVSLLAGTAAAMTVLLDGRSRMLGALGALYLIVAWQLSEVVPLPIAIVRGVVGAAVVAILARSSIGVEASLPKAARRFTGTGFRAAAILLVLIPISGVWGLGILGALPATQASGLGSLWVMGLGALQVGLSREVDRRTVGHLVLLSGFEMIYVQLEPSLALTVLLATVHLGLALVSVHLLSISDTGRTA